MNAFPQQAQDLSKHRWRNRVLVLTANSSELDLYQKQVQELLQDENGLIERKLVMYHVFPEKILQGYTNLGPSPLSSKHFTRFFDQNAPFTISLLGLDGGIKLQKTQILNRSELFGLIDGMPMRRAEIRRKN